ncbi:MAG: electron transfer flavoprotein subunit alpha/FixB family protein [Bacteroidota bacterium]|jgi:electron transfer flavoprotein alpha subunit
MSVLIYAETSKGKVKKSSLEAINYGAHIASQLGTEPVVLIANADSSHFEEVGCAGAKKILSLKNDSLNHHDAELTGNAVEQAAKICGAKVIVFSFDLTGKAVAPRVAARLKAGYVAGATDYPVISENNMDLKRNVFSGKATSVYSIHSEIKVISLLPNSFPLVAAANTSSVQDVTSEISLPASKIKVKEVKSISSGGTVPLPEAELVVSAGRGMKGPENWGMVEELAEVLGATTACSRPVSDMHWRPHHEHVGQTGIAIRPNLYIAIGISGAIQHLAGVNGSKTIVVINNDKEAPFFKSADYGIVGDAFEILPKLIVAFKKFKAGSN